MEIVSVKESGFTMVPVTLPPTILIYIKVRDTDTQVQFVN